MDVTTLADRLREAAEKHHPYEQSAPEHDWADWYAAYIDARENGASAEDASDAAARHVEDSATG